jgi:glycosyltransferase involved in cell wall biosynthesis
MTTRPTLSICVPSRNRQFYFQKTIEGLLRNKRQDVEFVFTDNSDDPSIMNDFMAEIVKDKRVVYIPSADSTLSMIDNWERSIRATTGEWVTFIGDDDFIEPDLAGLLERVVAVSPDLDAFTWGVLGYFWPEEGVDIKSVSVTFGNTIVKVPRSEAMRRMFGWFESSSIPTSGFSIYHGAIRRSLLETIRQTYGGVYFEHPNVDYEMAMKVIFNGRNFATCLRQFSVMGVCPLSNSYSIGRLEDTKNKIKIFTEELAGKFQDDPKLEDFPFSFSLGVSASIALTQHWFKEKYGLRYGGWEKAFVEACAYNTEIYSEEEAFEIVKAGYEAAFKKWQGGKFLKYYSPKRQTALARSDVVVTGFNNEGVYLRADIAGASTPAEVWDVLTSMVTPVEDIPVDKLGLNALSSATQLVIDANHGEPIKKLKPKELKKRGMVVLKVSSK